MKRFRKKIDRILLLIDEEVARLRDSPLMSYLKLSKVRISPV